MRCCYNVFRSCKYAGYLILSRNRTCAKPVHWDERPERTRDKRTPGCMFGGSPFSFHVPHRKRFWPMAVTESRAAASPPPILLPTPFTVPNILRPSPCWLFCVPLDRPSRPTTPSFVFFCFFFCFILFCVACLYRFVWPSCATAVPSHLAVSARGRVGRAVDPPSVERETSQGGVGALRRQVKKS